MYHPVVQAIQGPFLAYNNKLFFSARDNNNNAPYNIWISDGNPSGTHKFNTIANNNYDLHFEYNAKLYVSLDSIYTTDGTDTGTHPVINLYMGLPILFNNKLYFAGSGPNNNNELWTSDGTYTGTALVKEINPTLNGSSIKKLTVFNNRLIMSAFDGSNGHEIWISDGTAAGTYKPQFPNATHSNPLSSYDSQPFLEYHSELYFGAEYDSGGTELWKYNDDPASTNEVIPYNGVLKTWPNPAKNSVRVYAPESGDIVISDLVGRTIATIKISGSTAIDVSSYRPGMYFIRDRGGHCIKFVKE
jgi:ELWxxDGT repeat protein